MDISLLTSQVLFLLTLFFSISDITAQSNFSCSVDSPFSSCETHVAYFVQPPNYLNMGNVSDLFEASSSSIAKDSNLVSGVNDTQLFPGQLLLVPVTCGYTAKLYFANITYHIKKDDSYYLARSIHLGISPTGMMCKAESDSEPNHLADRCGSYLSFVLEVPLRNPFEKWYFIHNYLHMATHR